jgi:3-hydroxymyristoyl/3-hydroxydecanoyl-(acyl carrier protein) dehydratase
VTLEYSPEVRTWLTAASRLPLLPADARHYDRARDRHQIEELIPQRGTFLLVDEITHFDPVHAMIACRYTIDRAAPILADHFPGEPVWPGVLHVEAIGQAGLCLIGMLADTAEAALPGSFALTHILGAYFIHPITPDHGDVAIVARVVPDGLFHIVIGQCLQHGAVCSAAAVRGISKETKT